MTAELKPKALPLPKIKIAELKPIVLPAAVLELCDRGTARYDADDYIGAVEDFTRAIALDPRCWYAYYGRGAAGCAMNDFAAGVRDYARALEIEPGSTRLLFLRGQAQASMKEYAGAIEDFTLFLDRHPRDAKALWARGLAKEAAGDVAGAGEDFRASMGGPPDERKASTRLKLKGHRLRCAALAFVAVGAWIGLLATLDTLLGGPRQEKKNSWLGLVPLVGFMVVGWLFLGSLNQYRKARGAGDGELEDNTMIQVFLGIIGPFLFVPMLAWLFFMSRSCSVCGTAHRFNASVCRRCTAPL